MQADQRSGTPPPAPRPHWGLWLLAGILLGLLQVLWAGYQLGVGNQAIQVPFLARAHDATMFTRDLMVNLTQQAYPSLFFHLLAPLLQLADLAHLYLALHLLATVAVLIGVGALCRALFRDHWSGLVAILFLLGGHHQALAEELLYSRGFTHTWAVFPLIIVALTLFIAGRHVWAMACAGLIVNLHALAGGQLGLALGFATLCQVRQLGWRRVTTALAIGALAAAPTMGLILLHPQHFDPAWQQLMQLRSAYHSYPTTWWRDGVPDVPRFLLILSLAALAISLDPPTRQMRAALLVTAGVGLLFVLGTLFTEVWPSNTIIRAQLFRSSRVVMLLALATIARGCVRAWALPFARPPALPWFAAWLEFGAALAVAACLAVPRLGVLLPAVLVVTVLVALLSRRVSWAQATVCGATILACLAAWRSIHFVVPGLSGGAVGGSLSVATAPGPVGFGLLAAASLLWLLASRPLTRLPRVLATMAGAVLAGTVLGWTTPRLLQQAPGDAAWVDVQEWVRDHTLPEALVLTPIQPGGFRTHSQRAIVGDWRDGTQLYFSADYGPAWWERMNTLQPGMRKAPDGRRLLVSGRPLSDLEDDRLLAIAQRYGATHLVLASQPPHKLAAVYTNAEWAVYLPRRAKAVTVVDRDPAASEARFLREVAEPGIAEHRQSAVRLQVVDPTGRPLYDARYEITQTGSGFGWGATLAGFTLPATLPDARGELPPRLATPAERQRFAELFNFSVLTRSAWWSSIEPQEGQRQYDELERYLAWCREHGVRTEVSFLAGFPPAWLTAKPEKEQAAALERHALDLVDRYADRVDYWQVTDQGLFAAQVADLIKKIREKHPAVRLGVSDAGRFYSPLDGAAREGDLCRGLALVRQLKEAGAAPDFVALHGHQPWGVWATPADIVETLDAFAKEGVRVHLTELAVPAVGPIEGRSRQGAWTPQLQAECARLLCQVAFSHPAVDAVNFSALGPPTRVPGLNLLDAAGAPQPVFDALRQLITQTWRTRAQGVVPLDGRVRFRGFHGSYEVKITPVKGTAGHTTLTIAPDQPGEFRLQFNPADGKIEVSSPAAPAKQASR